MAHKAGARILHFLYWLPIALPSERSVVLRVVFGIPHDLMKMKRAVFGIPHDLMKMKRAVFGIPHKLMKMKRIGFWYSSQIDEDEESWFLVFLTK